MDFFSGISKNVSNQYSSMLTNANKMTTQIAEGNVGPGDSFYNMNKMKLSSKEILLEIAAAQIALNVQSDAVKKFVEGMNA